jgi:hypothetical protein
MPLLADREIRDRFGLTDATIARVIGKTRQAVNYGLERQKQYLRPHEWLLITLYLKAQNHPDLPELFAYVRKHHLDDAENIISAFGNFATEAEIARSSEVYAIIADYRYFDAENPRGAEFLRTLATSPTIRFSFLTSNKIDLDAFRSGIGLVSYEGTGTEREKNVECLVIPEVNQYPYMLICDPRTPKARYYVFGAGILTRLEKLRGKEVFESIMRDVREVRRRDEAFDDVEPPVRMGS